MVDKEKLRAIIYEVNEFVRTDPESIERQRELSRELSTLTREDLDKKITAFKQTKRTL